MSLKSALALTPLGLLLGACAMISAPSARNRSKAQNYFNAGLGFFTDGNYPESLRAFEKAASLSPNDPDIEMHRALALFNVGREEASIELMRATCRLREEFPECHNNLSYLTLKQGRYSESLAAADKALASPTYSSPDLARMNRGLALHALGRYRDAVASFSKVQERAPLQLRCRNELYLSRSHLALANFVEAVRFARVGRELCENEPRGHLWMGYIEYRVGEIGRARDTFTEIIRTFRDPEVRDEARVSLNRLNREEVLSEPKLFL
jgi:tetratricopeptide (TPR) repeat protein